MNGTLRRALLSALLLPLGASLGAQQILMDTLANTISGTVFSANGYATGNVCAIPGSFSNGLASQFEHGSGLNGRPGTDAQTVYANAVNFVRTAGVQCAGINTTTGLYTLTVPVAGRYTVVFLLGDGYGVPQTYVFRGSYTLGRATAHDNPMIVPSLGTSNVAPSASTEWMTSQLPGGQTFEMTPTGTGLRAALQVAETDPGNLGMPVTQTITIPFLQIARVSQQEKADSTWEVVVFFKSPLPIMVAQRGSPLMPSAAGVRAETAIDFLTRDAATDCRNYLLWQAQHMR